MTESILIDTIRIAGFRGLNNVEASLQRVTVLIGCNNAGKTSILKALQLSLGDYFRYVSEEDFHIDSSDKRSDEIIVDARIIPIDTQGQRTNEFSDEWKIEFKDGIQSEANGNQFVALRTRTKANLIKGGFETLRYTLEKWPDFSVWLTDKNKESKLSSKFLGLPFIPIEAQRDIHTELREKNSFAGKILSSIDYNAQDIAALEGLIKDLNDDAVKKSATLKKYKKHLADLHQSFQGNGNVDITPFPKKIRDLSKHFSVQFGESITNVFSMEYHGMGTRSWASMLTMKSFIELKAEQHAIEVEPFFPIIAVEEPEAHLHPNAQKTLYQQLSSMKGQIIISTHSPYLTAMSHLNEIRCVGKVSGQILAQKITPLADPEDERKLRREIIHSRGEVLFSRALILCEGETEEQALPILFKKFFGVEPFTLGINFIGVGGFGNYLPFLRLAKDFSIPVFIFSDGEPQVIKTLGSHYDAVFGKTDITKSPNITILDGTDFEDYLMTSGFEAQVEAAITKVDGVDAITKWITTRDGTPTGKLDTGKKCGTCSQAIYTQKLRDYKTANGKQKAMKEILDSRKTKYAPYLAEQLSGLDPKAFPKKIIAFFKQVEAGVKL